MKNKFAEIILKLKYLACKLVKMANQSVRKLNSVKFALVCWNFV